MSSARRNSCSHCLRIKLKNVTFFFSNYQVFPQGKSRGYHHVLLLQSSKCKNFYYGKIVVLFLEEEGSRKGALPLNDFSYSCQIPTDSSLEKMVCSALSSTSEDEAEKWGYVGDCHPKWSEAKNYLVHAVSWLRVYQQVLSPVYMFCSKVCQFECPNPFSSPTLPCCLLLDFISLPGKGHKMASHPGH